MNVKKDRRRVEREFVHGCYRSSGANLCFGLNSTGKEDAALPSTASHEFVLLVDFHLY